MQWVRWGTNLPAALRLKGSHEHLDPRPNTKRRNAPCAWCVAELSQAGERDPDSESKGSPPVLRQDDSALPDFRYGSAAAGYPAGQLHGARESQNRSTSRQLRGSAGG